MTDRGMGGKRREGGRNSKREREGGRKEKDVIYSYLLPTSIL